MQFTNFEDTKRFTSFRGSVPRQFREDHAHQRGYVPTFGSDIVCGVKYPPRRRESGGAQQRRAPGRASLRSRNGPGSSLAGLASASLASGGLSMPQLPPLGEPRAAHSAFPMPAAERAERIFGRLARPRQAAESGIRSSMHDSEWASQWVEKRFDNPTRRFYGDAAMRRYNPGRSSPGPLYCVHAVFGEPPKVDAPAQSMRRRGSAPSLPTMRQRRSASKARLPPQFRAAATKAKAGGTRRGDEERS